MSSFCNDFWFACVVCLWCRCKDGDLVMFTWDDCHSHCTTCLTSDLSKQFLNDDCLPLLGIPVSSRTHHRTMVSHRSHVFFCNPAGVIMHLRRCFWCLFDSAAVIAAHQSSCTVRCEELQLVGEIEAMKISVCMQFMQMIMAALCNSAGHYIFALWFLSSIYLSFFFNSSPNLSGHR